MKFKKYILFLSLGLAILPAYGSLQATERIYAPKGDRMEEIPLDSLLKNPPQDWSTGEVQIQNLGQTKNQSMHLVWVHKGEKLHTHAQHDATVLLVKGKGMLRLGAQNLGLERGSVISIPRGVVHAFTNTSKKPAAAYVVFTPPFDGKDVLEIGEMVK